MVVKKTVKTKSLVTLGFKWAIVGIILYAVFTLLPPALVPFIGEGPKTWALVKVATIIGVLYGLYLDFGSTLKFASIITSVILAVALLSTSLTPMCVATVQEDTGIDIEGITSMIEGIGGSVMSLISVVLSLIAGCIAMPVTFFGELLSVEGVATMTGNLLPSIENAITGAMYGIMLVILGALPTFCYGIICLPFIPPLMVLLGAISGFITGMGGERFTGTPHKFPGFAVP